MLFIYITLSCYVFIYAILSSTENEKKYITWPILALKLSTFSFLWVVHSTNAGENWSQKDFVKDLLPLNDKPMLKKVLQRIAS